MNPTPKPFVLQVKASVTTNAFVTVKTDTSLAALWAFADRMNACRFWRIVQSVRNHPEDKGRSERNQWTLVKLSPALKRERALRPPRRNRFQPGKTRALTSGAGDASEKRAPSLQQREQQ